MAKRQDGAALRQLRREHGIKSPELASTVGIATVTLLNAELEHTSLSIEVLYRIARELDIPIQQLLSEAGRRELEVGRAS